MGLPMPARIICILLCLAPFCGFSSVDIFLKIEKINGESTDAKHTDDIDVLAWSWGMASPASFADGGKANTGSASFQDITITKFFDKSTPSLLLNCANGTRIGKMELFVRKQGKDPAEFLVITFEEVLVTSVSTGGSGGEDRLVENVSFAFGRIRLEYKAIDENGSLGSPEKFGWDVEKNEKI